MKIRRLLYGGMAGLCLLAGALAGIAGSSAAGNHTKAHRSSTQHPGFPGRGPQGGPQGPPIHSVSVVPNKAENGFDTVTQDGGTVKSLSGQELTITEGTKTLTYKTVTLTIPGGATVQRDGKTAQLSDLQAGDHVIVIGNSDGTTMVCAFDSSFKPPHGPGPGGPGGPGGPPPGFPGNGSPESQGNSSSE